jgi:mono/diheme cytochrome c family protein
MVRMKILPVLFCLTTLSGAARAENKPPFDLNDPKRIEMGKLRFETSCAGYCHGFDGVGGAAPAFKARGDDLDPNYAFETITNGRKGHHAVMPRWGGAYTPEQIWELVAYLEFLAHEKPSQKN